MGTPRTLSLHESALSPSEYTVYIPLFDDLVDADTDVNAKQFNAHASIPVPVREARGWLKGRYPGVESGLIDRVRILLLQLSICVVYAGAGWDEC